MPTTRRSSFRTRTAGTRRTTTGRRTTTTARRSYTTSAGRTNSTTGRTNNTTTTFGTWTPGNFRPTQFTTCKKEIQQRVGSYRNISGQFSGTGKVQAFSPSIANRWIKFVDDGCRVFKWTNSEFCRHFGKQWTSGTPTAAFRFLRGKFGASVKAVTRGKGGCWLIAATNRVNGRPFNTYSWK